MQHGEDRGRPGHDPSRRHVAACRRTRPRQGTLDPADDDPPFTLGVVNVSPMSMAAAYAAPAANGVYCKPIVLTKIVNDAGQSLPVPSAGCHQAISGPGRAGRELHPPGRATRAAPPPAWGSRTTRRRARPAPPTWQAATARRYAAFAGYTTALASYVSVFNPASPTTYTMTGTSACYQLEYGGQDCPAEMFGANAPGIDVAHDLRPRQPVRVGELPAGSAGELPVERGRRPGGQAAEEARQGRQGRTATAGTATAETAANGNGNGNGPGTATANQSTEP